MIDRYALLAGAVAALIYGLLYLAYEVTHGWEVPAAVALGLGVLVVVATTAATQVGLRRLAPDGPSKEV